MSVKFIAEVSSNHNQDLERSLKFVEVAADCGFDAVKFQLFKVEELFSSEAIAHNPDINKRKKWELPVSFLEPLANRTLELGMEFSCTPFYIDAVDSLEPFVDFYKIASYELLWHDLLFKCATKGKPIVLSTGMANLEEIDLAVSAVKIKFPEIDLSLLHAVSSYPAPIDECNLKAIAEIRDRYGVVTGWSDHTINPGVINASIFSHGAEIIEMHLDLDGLGAEFESGHCWMPQDAKDVIKSARDGIMASSGSGIKLPTPAEMPDREWRADPSDGLRPLISKRNWLSKNS